MLERIQEIILKHGLNASKFADEIGLQRSNVSHVLSGRNKPSLDFVLRILKSFPDVNADWLLFGKGSYDDKKMDLFAGEQEKDVDKEAEKAAEQTDIQTADPGQKELKSPAKPKNSRQDIRKVLIFYEDGSFESYYPKR